MLQIALEASDTRDSLLESKELAETAYINVARKYHLLWLPIIGSWDEINLSKIKSICSGVPTKHAPIAGFQCDTKEYLDCLYASITHELPKFDSMMQQMAQECGVQSIVAPLKSKKRVWEKALFDYENDQSKVIDIGRGSAIAINLKKVILVAEWILKNCKVMRMKNRFCDESKSIIARGGYRDILINIDLNSIIFEIQIHLESLYNLKQESHSILDIARAAIEPTLYKLRLLDQQDSKDQLLIQLRKKDDEIARLKAELEIQNGGWKLQEIKDDERKMYKMYQNVVSLAVKKFGTKYYGSKQHFALDNAYRISQCSHDFAKSYGFTAVQTMTYCSFDWFQRLIGTDKD